MNAEPKLKKSGRPPISSEKAARISELLGQRMRKIEISRQLGVSLSTVNRIRKAMVHV